MAASRSAKQLAEIGSFIQRLYELGGYATWKEFADDARLSAPQLSDFQRGEAEPSGYNLLRLINAATARAGADALTRASSRAEQDVGVPLMLAHLAELQDTVAHRLLGQAEILDGQTQLLDRVAESRRRERGEQTEQAPARKAAGRKR